MSTPLRTSFLIAAACLLAACTEDQSKAIGNAPKKTIDNVSSKVGKLMQQGGQDSERLKEEQK